MTKVFECFGKGTEEQESFDKDLKERLEKVYQEIGGRVEICRVAVSDQPRRI